MNHPVSEPSADNDFYYFILNLNRGASQAEINERHRALSLIFHPDKQRDDNSREIATKKFLEIQKAYQVLSDPFLRQVYDILGERGLSIRWNSELRSKPLEEVKKILLQTQQDIAYKDFEAKISPSGTTTCAFDATALFEAYDGDDSFAREINHRLEDVRLLSFGTKYSVKKRLSDSTILGLKTRLERLPRGHESSLMGTLRHQFSPRFTAEADLGFFWPHVLHLKGTYNENGNTIAINASSMLGAFGERPPSVNLSVSRRLFRHRFETASFDLAVGGQPQFSINLTSPSVFGVQSLEQSGESDLHSAAPSVSGLEVGSTHTKLGIAFDSILPTLVLDWGVNLAELALQLKIGIQCGLVGISWVFAGTWSNSDSSITLATLVNPTGISIRFDLEHLHQRISLPIILCLEPRTDLALWTVFLPSTALVVGYHLIIKPRRRRQHLEYIRATRKALEEDSGRRNDRQAIIGLLKDSARRSEAAETSKGGLIITEAIYGPQFKDAEASDLVINVTISLQALVRHSQLYVSADHPKSAIQGFSDPAPSTPKMLSIRYVFAGHIHYAEIPDDLPVVLPLAEHLVE